MVICIKSTSRRNCRYDLPVPVRKLGALLKEWYERMPEDMKTAQSYPNPISIERDF